MGIKEEVAIIDRFGKQKYDEGFLAGYAAASRWVSIADKGNPLEAGWYLLAWMDKVNYDPQIPSIEFFNEAVGEWDLNMNIRQPLAWTRIPMHQENK